MNSFSQELEKILDSRNNPNWKSNMQKTIEKMESSRHIFIYGLGQCSQELHSILSAKTNRQIRYIDENPLCMHCCDTVISISDLKNYLGVNTIIIIDPSLYSDDIIKHLDSMGFGAEQIINDFYAHNYLIYPDEFSKFKEGYEWAYNFFEDDISRQTIIDRMRLMLLDEPMQKNSLYAQYFEQDLYNFSTNEVFIDAGAYVGETSMEFIKLVKEQYSHIYLFEPVQKILDKAINTLSSYNNITFICKGLYDCEDEISFFIDSISQDASTFELDSRRGTHGIEKVVTSVTSLDTYFAEKAREEWPTFIKMDIEGAERAALFGASDIIKYKKPKLAISAYHKIEDIYDLVKTIVKIRSDYKFALRHSVTGPWDTNLYAF
jgi:FkbM family methyltransferase